MAFIDTSTGERLALDRSDGAVWIYLHDASDAGEMPGALVRQSASFSDFLAGLRTQAEWEAMMEAAGDPVYAAFKVQLAQIETERIDAEDALRGKTTRAKGQEPDG